MLRRARALAVSGGLALGLVACSNSTSSKTIATTSTSPRTTTTKTLAPLTAPPETLTTSATASPVASAPSVAQAPDSTSPLTTPATRAATVTTVAGRVVTRPNDNVHLGDTGSGVKQVQVALAAHGYKVTADGNFGAHTDQAVRSFQGSNGLKQDGIVGPATWTKLQTTPTTTTIKPSPTTIKSTTTTRH